MFRVLPVAAAALVAAALASVVDGALEEAAVAGVGADEEGVTATTEAVDEVDGLDFGEDELHAATLSAVTIALATTTARRPERTPNGPTATPSIV
jgi:hypothetical protein